MDNVDPDDNPLHMVTQHEMFFNRKFTDFSFAPECYSEDAIVSSFISSQLKCCLISLGPDYQGCNYQKLHVEFVGACK